MPDSDKKHDETYGSIFSDKNGISGSLKCDPSQKMTFLTSLLRSVPDLVFLKDINGAFLCCNEVFSCYVGRPVDEIIGKSSHDIFNSSLADAFRHNDIKVMQSLSPCKSVEWIDCDDGNKALLETFKAPLFSEYDELIGVVGIARDITGRKQSEAKIQETKDELLQVVNGNPIASFAINRDHEIIYWNRACEKTTGIRENEMIGKKDSWMAFYEEKRPTLADLIVDGSLAAIEENYNGKKLTSSFVEGGYQADQFFPALGKWILFTAAPLRDNNNNIIGAIEALHDITLLKDAEISIIESKILAENASRAKSELLCNMDHEMRTPLNLILGYADMLLSKDTGQLNEEQRHFARIIRSGGERLLDLVDSLISKAESEENTMELYVDKVSVPAMIKDIECILNINATKKGVKLKFDIDSRTNVIHADRSKIKSILYHLISNGIKFTPSGGTVSVNIMKSDGGELHMFVRDTGMGISQIMQKQLHDAFSQSGHFYDVASLGNGLGLNIVKKFTDIHGGRIDFESKQDQGTCFKVVIPLLYSSPVNCADGICNMEELTEQ
ncbi:MAG: PAS domain S-box protein [Methanolobus sp.]|nr:PAS domain S-box protein [Methanolobus sp.]